MKKRNTDEDLIRDAERVLEAGAAVDRLAAKERAAMDADGEEYDPGGIGLGGELRDVAALARCAKFRLSAVDGEHTSDAGVGAFMARATALADELESLCEEWAEIFDQVDEEAGA